MLTDISSVEKLVAHVTTLCDYKLNSTILQQRMLKNSSSGLKVMNGPTCDQIFFTF